MIFNREVEKSRLQQIEKEELSFYNSPDPSFKAKRR